MRTAMVNQSLAEARAHLRAIRRHAEAAQARRREIAEDWRYEAGGRQGKRARQDDLGRLGTEATDLIAREVAGVHDALRWVDEYELAPEATSWRTPSPAAQAAGERVRAMLDGGVNLRDALQALADDNDQPALEWAQRSIGALVRAQVAATDPGRVDSPEVRSLVADLDTRLARARLPHMTQGERDYTEARLAVADLRESAERERVYWTKTARGTASTHDKFSYGLATDPKWVESMADTGTWAEPDGPVEQANTPEPVAG